MAFSVLLHTAKKTGQDSLIVQDTTQSAIISGSMVSFDGGATFQPYTYLGQGNYRGTGQTGEFIQVGGQIYAWDANNPTGPMTTGNWKITPNDLNPTDPPCFVSGTLIETDCGPRPVEDLAVGDRVCVAGGTTLPIEWIGKRTLSAQILRIRPQYNPVCIRRDALGKGLPDRDIYLSPQHRVVLGGWRAELYFGAPSVFCAAIHLVNDDTIRQVTTDEAVTYYHIACAEHVILTSHGLQSESLFPGDMALKSLHRDDVEELRALFPGLLSDAGPPPQTRLSCLTGREARALRDVFAD